MGLQRGDAYRASNEADDNLHLLSAFHPRGHQCALHTSQADMLALYRDRYIHSLNAYPWGLEQGSCLTVRSNSSPGNRGICVHSGSSERENKNLVRLDTLIWTLQVRSLASVEQHHSIEASLNQQRHGVQCQVSHNSDGSR